MIQIAAMALGSHLVLAADRVPQFDATRSCKSAAVASMMTGRTADNCIADENNARAILEKSWGEFSAADKSHCGVLQRTGGSPSYVELLSCLEMSRDARNMSRDNKNNRGVRPGSQNGTPDQTTGAASPTNGQPLNVPRPTPNIPAPHRQPRPM